MTLHPAPLLLSAAAVFAILGSARAAHAGEQCLTDDDCGHGFECETLSSGTGGAGGTAGSGASVGGTSSGAFAPQPCGDGVCQAPETLETCDRDCSNTVCVLAECESTDDCAEGYECRDEPMAGTGGTTGAACGDGLCTIGETEETCATDCTATRRCSPAGGICTSDEQCAAGFYCSFVGSGSGGNSGSGSGGFAGTSGTSSGGAAPATGGTATGGSGSSVGGSSSDGADAALAAGTCMPEEDGAGGTSGSGGSIGSGAAPGTGGVGTGGTGTSGSSFGGSGAFGTGGFTSTGGASGSSGTGTGGTGGSGSGGTAAATGSGGSTGGTGTGTGETGTGGHIDEGEQSPPRGGCSIVTPLSRSSFPELGAFLLVALSVLGRRRRV